MVQILSVLWAQKWLHDKLSHLALAAGDDLRMYEEALRQAKDENGWRRLNNATIARKLFVIRSTCEQWGKKRFLPCETGPASGQPRAR